MKIYALNKFNNYGRKLIYSFIQQIKKKNNKKEIKLGAKTSNGQLIKLIIFGSKYHISFLRIDKRLTSKQFCYLHHLQRNSPQNLTVEALESQPQPPI